MSVIGFAAHIALLSIAIRNWPDASHLLPEQHQPNRLFLSTHVGLQLRIRFVDHKYLVSFLITPTINV
jgi:hypothetical protein